MILLRTHDPQQDRTHDPEKDRTHGPQNDRTHDPQKDRTHDPQKVDFLLPFAITCSLFVHNFLYHNETYFFATKNN